MALKIITPIGTDKGITSEAYVRISNYSLNKYGSATFTIEIYQSESDINSNSDHFASQVTNQQIGKNILVMLNKTIVEQLSFPTSGIDEEGNQLPDTIESVSKLVPDLSSAQGIDIFTFGYSHLKAKLIELFGEDNIIDC